MRFDYKHWTTYEGLVFKTDTSDGVRWFISRDKEIVCFDGEQWTVYGVADGLIDDPGGLIATRAGEIWVAGSHQHQAATARFDGERWSLNIHAEVARNLHSGALFEAQDGSLWFGAFDLEQDDLGGLLQFDGQRWIHHIGTKTGFTSYAIAQSPDGTIWTGQSLLRSFDGHIWQPMPDPAPPRSWIHSLYATEDDLWVGTRIYGVLHFDGHTWQQFTMHEGLDDNWIKHLKPMPDGSILAITTNGYSLFDGHNWRSLPLPIGSYPKNRWPNLHLDRDASMWFISGERSIHYQPEREAPDTELTLAVEVVSDQGHATLAWRGDDPWKATPNEKLHYAWRLNSSEWTSFAPQTTHTFLDLSSGDYIFEVKTRDWSFNEDPTPARVAFTVLAPVWRRPWFLSLMGALFVVVTVQTRRVIRRDRRLQVSNEQLQIQAQDLAEANLEIQQANQAKSAFLANMSHEIRTPMNAILGYAQILRNHDDLPPELQHRNIEAIYSSGDHLLKLINDVLDLSKIEAGRMELQPIDFDLAQLVESLATMFELRCRQQGLDWRVVHAHQAWPVHADENKLSQILVNLLGNAVKFTAEGEVVFTVEAQSEHRYYFAVQDTGPGIPPQQQQTIFEPFQQGPSGVYQGGTGLGLAIARRHVELMGGQLQLDSTPGQGARFFFALPLPPAQGPVVSQLEVRYGQVIGLKAGYAPQILIVDDMANNREILVQMLEYIGASVRQAESGVAALAAVDQARPDLVFMDIRMPGMDGAEALRRLRQTHGALPVVAISASVMEHEKQHYLRSGFDAFIDKPFRVEALYACLVELLGVEYEYAAQEEVSAVEQPIALPAELVQRCTEAAQFYRMTELHRYVAEVEALGEGGRALAQRLRARVQAYDMDGVVALLNETEQQ